MNSSDQIQAEREMERLRDAAPQMLAALKLVRDWLCYDGPVVDDGITHPAFVKANNAVHAAIQRATGARV